jgi:hypothetical protein
MAFPRILPDGVRAVEAIASTVCISTMRPHQRHDLRQAPLLDPHHPVLAPARESVRTASQYSAGTAASGADGALAGSFCSQLSICFDVGLTELAGRWFEQ